MLTDGELFISGEICEDLVKPGQEIWCFLGLCSPLMCIELGQLSFIRRRDGPRSVVRAGLLTSNRTGHAVEPHGLSPLR